MQVNSEECVDLEKKNEKHLSEKCLANGEMQDFLVDGVRWPVSRWSSRRRTVTAAVRCGAAAAAAE